MRTGQHHHRQRRRQRRIRAILRRDGDRDRPRGAGRKYVAVSDERGNYRSRFRQAPYKLRRNWPGFGTARSAEGGLLGSGENASIAFALNFTLARNADGNGRSATSRSDLDPKVAGNVDRLARWAMPLQGPATGSGDCRTMLVKGRHHRSNVTNSVRHRPEQVVQRPEPRRPANQAERLSAAGGEASIQPRGDCEFRITNLFDIRRAIHRGARCRRSQVEHQQPVRRRLRVLPRRQVQRARPDRAPQSCHAQNQQTGFAVGGPIMKTGSTYFFTYSTKVIRPSSRSRRSSARPHGVESDQAEQLSGPGRFQISPPDTLSMRASQWQLNNPFSLSGRTFRPWPGILSPRSLNGAATWSRVFITTASASCWSATTTSCRQRCRSRACSRAATLDFPSATMGAPFATRASEGMSTFQFRCTA